MSSRHASGGLRVATLALVSLVLLSTVAGTVAAQSYQGASGTIIIGPDETYDSVEGVAGTVIVRGTVTGDVETAAGTVHVTEAGEVGGNIEAAAGTVRIDGTVGGNVSVAGGTVEIGETAQIGGHLEAGAGFLAIHGTVDGTVRAGAEEFVLGPTASVGGDVRYDAATFTRDPEATIGGSVVQDESIGDSAGPDSGEFALPSWIGVVYGLLVNLLLGAILLAAFPSFSARVAGHVAERPAKSGGVGLLTLVAVPVVLVVLLFTIVGIPLSLVGAVIFGVAVWVAVVYGQFAAGSWALSLADRENRWLALVVGLIGFAILGAIPVVGWVFELLALLLGLGALALTLRESYQRRGNVADGRQTTLDEIDSDTTAA
ncbi:polymer-forming cytoskeletal protein [Haloarcula hispanica]|uniref:Polymer-forming cytoskeletal protein n=1 Tax=Haloarcula hispanica TaxID=51589 RepID=A0A482T8E7_HALHI|nr:polymer-forming cytoskeletal protein [Haloarcula hispanica]MCJ0618331.1 polymer-forming cytoskeletal protein [Haloarcula hispanica]RYJ08935.1 polymer-forming cytoskeletal protein [Haloarcula hispanica]